MVTAFIGLGTNLGERMENLAKAADALAHLPETHVETVSHAYESRAAYVEDQPPFANAVVEITTSLEPEALLAHLHDIEERLGRTREQAKGPRIIDLDLLLFGDEEINSPTLVVPHPGIEERDFVVTPLLEIAPRVTLPDGRHLKPSAASVGLVLRDLGEVPDFGAEHNMPIDADDWEVVYEAENPTDALAGFDAGLQLAATVLGEEGVPFAFDPYEPGTEMDPFGMVITYKLLVPLEYAERARRLLEEVVAAPPEFGSEDAPA